MLFTYGPFSREAAQDRSPWMERSGTLGKNRRGANPERGVGKQTHDAGAGAANVNKPTKAFVRRNHSRNCLRKQYCG